MRWVAALAIALAVAPASASTGPAVTFASPAQWTGTADAQGTWALVYFLDGGASADADLAVTVVDNMSRVMPGIVASPALVSSYPVGLPTSSRNIDAQVQQELRFQRPGRGYVYVEAEAVEARLPVGDGILTGLSAGEDVGWGFPSPFQAPAYPRIYAATDSAAAGWGGDAGSRFVLAARGVRSVIWSNADAICGDGACLDGAGTVRIETAPGEVQARMLMESELHIAATSGTFNASGLAVGMLVGGATLSIDAQGSMRLPLADMQAACEGCRVVDGQTLLLEGGLRLDGVKPTQKDRLGAMLGGDVAAVRLDEESVEPASLVPAASVLGVAAVGAVVLLWKLLALLALRDPLANRTRRSVFDAVVAQPGATYRDLMAATGLGDGTVRHHLRVLRDAGLIAIQRQSGQTHHFENHGRYDATWKGVAGLRDPTLHDLYAWLQANPGARLRDACMALAAPKTTTHKRLRRLVEWGLVEPDGTGYRARFTQAKPSQVAAAESD